MKQFFSVRKAIIVLIGLVIFLVLKNWLKPGASKRDTVNMPPFDWEGQTVEGKVATPDTIHGLYGIWR
jgi:hypothetical protein